MARNANAATGNSAFGKKQGTASTRTTGSANNAYGQARKATVQARNAARKAAKTTGSAGSKGKGATMRTTRGKSTTK